MSTCTVKMNGRSYTADEGQTVLQLAAKNGISIPTLCHHPALEAHGGCRLCIVEGKMGKRTRMVTACNYEVWEGLEVLTDSPRVHKNRALTLELLLARCPESTPIRKLAGQYGVSKPRFAALKDDCILCGLCVRVCQNAWAPPSRIS